MERLTTGTPDGTQENIERIAAMFPQVLTEVENEDGELEQAIDFDALRELLGDVAEGQRERYQFTWPGKQEAKAEARRPIDKTMRPEPERSVDWDTTKNLYIEGDNLDALKLLKETYTGKIKLIYIDPPYNTGHDFVYDDDFSRSRQEYDADNGEYDEEGGRLVSNTEGNGRFHSDWCSMMYPRLQLARELLSRDGAIFISIDDNEYKNLRNLADEIYGEKNFLCTCVWQKRTSPEARKVISAGHEYIVVYLKTASTVDSAINKRELTAEDMASYSNPDNDPRGPWASTDFTAPGYRPNQMYSITTPNGTVVEPPAGRCWKNVESVFEKLRDEGRLWFGEDGGGVPRQKVYLSDRNGRSSWTWWTNREVGHTQEATKELGALLGKGIFDFPKPLRLLQRIVQLGTNKDSLILDFFSGSAGLAQAVFEQNVKDGGNRRSILVQIPESIAKDTDAYREGYRTICDIGEERIRRAGRKIRDEVDELNLQPGLDGSLKSVPDVGFRVLRVDSSNFKDTRLTPGETSRDVLFGMADNVKPGRSGMDLLFEVLPRFRIPYSAKIEVREINGRECFVVNDDQLVACFDANVDADTIEAIARMEPSYAVMSDASLADDATASNFEELFRTYSPDTVRCVI